MIIGTLPPVLGRLICLGLCVALAHPGEALAMPTGDEGTDDEETTAVEGTSDEGTPAVEETSDEGTPAVEGTSDEGTTAVEGTAAVEGTPRTTSNEPDLGAPARASLAVDTSAVGPQSLVLLRRIEELGEIELLRAEVLPSHSERDPLLKISLRPLDEGGYAIVSALMIAGELLPNSEREVFCNLCTEGETVERARIEVDRLIPYIRAHAADEAKAASERAEAANSDDQDSPADTQEPPRFGLKGKAGLALLGVGIAGAGVGAVLAARQPTVKPDMPLETRDTRTPGYITLGLAGGALITGAALLILDRRPATQRIAIVPDHRGITLFGRF